MQKENNVSSRIFCTYIGSLYLRINSKRWGGKHSESDESGSDLHDGLRGFGELALAIGLKKWESFYRLCYTRMIWQLEWYWVKLFASSMIVSIHLIWCWGVMLSSTGPVTRWIWNTFHECQGLHVFYTEAICCKVMGKLLHFSITKAVALSAKAFNKNSDNWPYILYNELIIYVSDLHLQFRRVPTIFIAIQAIRSCA